MYAYPMLRRAEALDSIAAIERTLMRGEKPVAFVNGGHHPAAIFKNVALLPIPIGRLHDLRDRVLSTAAAVSASSRGWEGKFDAAVGSTLNEWFEIEGRSIAADSEIWSYLAIVVLPDVATHRFGPDKSGRLTPGRFLPGRRNAFHRLYLRSWILGELLDSPESGFLEDELVSLVDRSLSADHRLARRIAQNIVHLGKIAAANRRLIMREAMKDVQFELRVTNLGALSDTELNQLVDDIYAKRLWRQGALRLDRESTVSGLS